jgi:DNA-binding response OmpR family regulator
MPDQDDSIAKTVQAVKAPRIKASPRTRAVYAALYNHAIKHPGQPMPRAEIVRRAWGSHYLQSNYDSTLDAHICFLRDALGDCQQRMVVTVRGVGYYLAETESEAQ